jgi:peptidyl-prolyl cis-trans isomerase SurA
MQAGAAAVVGQERITSSQLDQNIRYTEAALAKVPGGQQQLPLSIPQTVLLQLVEMSRYNQLAERNSLAVTDGEVDRFIATQGGARQVEQTLLPRGVAPEQSKEYIRAFLTAQKLLAKFGGGTDEASMQRGQEQLVKQLDALPVSYNPRYGKFDPQQGGFVGSDRFGKPKAQPAAPPQGAQGGG